MLSRPLRLPVLIIAIGTLIGAYCFVMRYQISLRLVTTPEQTSFDFTKVAPFEWDRMYVFGPYTSQQDAELKIGAPWPLLAFYPYDDSESVECIAFTKDRRLVAWSTHDRGTVLEVGYLSRPNGWSRSEATFAIRPSLCSPELVAPEP